MSEDALPEADRAENAPHPRHTPVLFGQRAAEEGFLDAVRDGRRHHAWLLTGPSGIGKATLAWRMARYLRCAPPADGGLFAPPPLPETLDIPSENPISRQMNALADPGTLLIRRAWDADKKKLKTQITVDDVRRLNAFFGMSLPDGGARVVIVDSADELNPSAANALLKVLEEPPEGAALFLVSHQPARLLPTIRSRCRTLRLTPLGQEDLTRALVQAGAEMPDGQAVSALANGSPGEAVRLIHLDGIAIYERLVDLLSTIPQLDRQQAIAFIEKTTARSAAPGTLDLALRLFDLALTRVARTAAGHPPDAVVGEKEHHVLAHLSKRARAQEWAVLQQDLSARLGHGMRVNVDPSSLLLDAFLQVNSVG